MAKETSDGSTTLFVLFDYGNNPAFDEMMARWGCEAARARDAGETVPTLEEYVMDWVLESNIAYTHSDFVTEIQKKTITIRWLVEPYTILNRGGNLFGIFALLYQFAPFAIFPICAYLTHDWWLLIGIVLSRGASRFAARNYNVNSKARPNKTFAGVLLVLLCAIGSFWIYSGLQNGYVFWSFALLWGFTFYILTEVAQMTYAIQSLVNSSQLFAKTISQNKVFIERQNGNLKHWACPNCSDSE